MPELPEVETVRSEIESLVCGKVIKSVLVRRFDLRKRVPDNFDDMVRGKFIKSVKRRAKYIIFELDNHGGEAMILHLGMSGSVRVYNSKDAKDYQSRKHDHIIVIMEDGSCMVYEDPRRFGVFYPVLCGGDEYWDALPPFDKMGPEPLGGEWGGGMLYDKIKKRSASIKSLLLNQSVVAGLGNIYVCEALYIAGVHPELRGKDLDKAKSVLLANATKAILSKAIEAGGSTLRDYKRVDGSGGNFQHNFQVYGREGKKCVKKGCAGVVDRISQAGRSTFYCPLCQRRGKITLSNKKGEAL